jgi:hypothetical protein
MDLVFLAQKHYCYCISSFSGKILQRIFTQKFTYLVEACGKYLDLYGGEEYGYKIGTRYWYGFFIKNYRPPASCAYG